MNIRGLACAGVLFASACSHPGADPAANPVADPGAGAVWTVKTGDQLGADTTTFTAMVRRVGCNNGVTGDVQEPELRLEDDRVVITFTVKSDPSAANCLGNNEVAHVVALPEPLGGRDLVDGQCEADGEGSRTTFCRPDGVRYSPG